MSNLGTLAAKAAALRVKMAAEPLYDPDNVPTGLGTGLGAGLMGTSAVTGLTAAGLHAGKRQLENRVTFRPEAVQEIGRLARTMEAPTPGHALANYSDAGAALTGRPMTRGGMPGTEVMKTLYENPYANRVFRMAGATEEGWTRGRAEHYGEFAKGPVRGQAQMAREVYRDPGRMRELALGERAPAGNAYPAADVYGDMNRRVARTADRLVARGQLAPGTDFWRGGGKYRDYFQGVFNRLDRQFKGGEGVKGDPKFQQARATAERVARNVGQAGDAGDIMRRQLYRFARADPEAALHMHRLGLKGVPALEQLPHEVQAGLLERFNTTTGMGKTLASDAMPLLRRNADNYKVLSGVVSTPDTLLKNVGRHLGTARNVLGGAAAGLGGLGTLLFLGGRSADRSSARAAASERYSRLLADLQGRFQAQRPTPPAPAEDPTARQIVSAGLFDRVKGALSNWYRNMKARVA
jgi:hypothetical protein